MSRGGNSSPAIVIIVIILVILIIPSCICGGLFVVGLGTAVRMEGLEKNAQDQLQIELKHMDEEFQKREAELKDNASESREYPATDGTSPTPNE
ncbi:MAG: hypothetical protein ACKVH8_13690 [Pirellulales bacterium]|jgi:hypothetical protein